MKSYKLKLLARKEDDVFVFLDFYADVEAINGFFIPIPDAQVEGETPDLFVLSINGAEFEVLQEYHIVEYLNKKFYTECIKA